MNVEVGLGVSTAIGSCSGPPKCVACNSSRICATGLESDRRSSRVAAAAGDKDAG